MRTVVVKVGSSSITTPAGALDRAAMDSLARQLALLVGAGTRCLLVSSGAIAAGRNQVGVASTERDVDVLQGLAAVGQGILMSEHTRCFREHGATAAQVLLTARDFGERAAYLNARRTLDRLLSWSVIPVINENDTVATDELTFGENDRLAALVATMVGAHLLLILTDTAGVFSADPRLGSGATLVEQVTDFDAALASAGSPGRGHGPGSGGMAAKIAAARIAAWSGIPCVIASAAEPDIVLRAVAGDAVGTRVPARDRRLGARKVWIAFALAARGRIGVDDGAVEAICRQGRSLLPVGIRAIEGEFEPGEAVEIIDDRGTMVAKGLVRTSADRLRDSTGHGVAGASTKETAVHRDDLVVLSA